MNGLQIEEVTKLYGSLKALDSVTLDVSSAEFLVIMGPSGCGKTTLLLILLGILQADSGHVYLNGESIDSLTVEDRNFGYVPQDYGLFPHMNVFDNVAFGMRVRGLPKGEMTRIVDELLELVDLRGLKTRRPVELSGGQKQRVALARALAIRPSILLLDEPMSNVDEATKAEVRGKLKETTRKAGVTTICVLHEPADAAFLGDRIAIMYAGRIIQIDTLEILIQKPKEEIVTRLLTSGLLGLGSMSSFDR